MKVLSLTCSSYVVTGETTSKHNYLLFWKNRLIYKQYWRIGVTVFSQKGQAKYGCITEIRGRNIHNCAGFTADTHN